MLDNLLGNMNEQQEELEKKLKEIEITEKTSHNELVVIVNGKKDIIDITINKEFGDITELEDLLVLTLNKAFKEADNLAANATQQLLNSMLPDGLSSLSGMFG